MTKHTVTLTDNQTGKQVELDVLEPTIGPKTIDIRKLYKETGYFTYDPGYLATASCSSQITYLDGGEGTLLYRGYPIEQLAEQSTFLEVCYLLLCGELPSRVEMEKFEDVITHHTMLHDQVQYFYRG
ncbi:MAG: citrate/2-methylcitrate synthase, partial [Thiolinea sp.]